jgi:hypothetical protein
MVYASTCGQVMKMAVSIMTHFFGTTLANLGSGNADILGKSEKT